MKSGEVSPDGTTQQATCRWLLHSFVTRARSTRAVIAHRPAHTLSVRQIGCWGGNQQHTHSRMHVESDMKSRPLEKARPLT